TDRSWTAGVPKAIAVHNGRAKFRVATSAPTSETLVVVSALTRSPGSYPIRLTARSVARAVSPAPAFDGPRVATRLRVSKPPPEPDPDPGNRLPPQDRIFHLMVGEGDVAIPSNYAPIRGVLRGVGRRVQVYAAAEDVEKVDPQLVDEVIRTFDERIHPL